MPRAKIQMLFNQAEDMEKTHNWLEAARCFTKIGSLAMAPFEKATSLENTGYAFYRAAFQAENNEEFRARCTRSIKSYGKAVQHFLRSEEANKNPSILRCRATIAFINYWLTADPAQKKEYVNECWEQTKEALRNFKEKNDSREFIVTYNRLADGALFAFFLDWSFPTRRRLATEAIDFGEQTIALLSDSIEANEQAKAIGKTLVCMSLFAYNFLDVSDREKQYEKIFAYWSRARELNEDVAVLEILHPFFGPNVVFGVEGTDEALGNFKRALDIAEKTSDKFLIASAFDWLTYHSAWAIRRTEDTDRQQQLYEEAAKYARKAKELFGCVSFISPRSDLAWIEDTSKIVSFSSIMVNETDLRKKRVMLGEALKEAPVMLRRASGSGYPETMLYAHHVFSFILTAQSKLETITKRRKKILEEALEHRRSALSITSRIQPFMYWNRGVMHNLLATARSELAELTKEPGAKQAIIRKAIANSNASLKLKNRDLQFYRSRGRTDALIAQIGEIRFFHGNLLIQLYSMTKDRADLERAIQSYRQALSDYRGLAIMSRVAECYWKIALIYDAVSEHTKSARNFEHASESYRKAARKFPLLKDFFKEHSIYMLSWSEIEKARDNHKKQYYGHARHHFKKAAQLHGNLEHWKYLAPSYLAWAMVEYGEELSRKDRPEEASRVFDQAAYQFKKTAQSVKTHLPAIESLEEKTMATNILRGTDARFRYCLARINLEKGRLLDKKGDHASSARVYGAAVKLLKKIEGRLEYERDRREFRFLILVSQAWERMMKAETEASPSHYKQASEYFENAEECSSNQRSRMLVLGHCQFCKALEIGMRIANVMNKAEYLAAKKHLENASNHYVRARFQEASEYAKGTELLLDAYWHIDCAKKDNDPEEKARGYMLAEKALERSVLSFKEARHLEKAEQVGGILRRVQEVRDLAISLSSLLSASRIASARNALTVPTPSYEEAVGLESFEHADVRAIVMAHQSELSVGEDLDLEIELVNVGKGPALLTKIKGIFPEGFKVISKPDNLQEEDGHISMKGKRLDSLKTEEIRLVLRPNSIGVFTLAPAVFFLEEDGNYKVSHADQITITVRQPTTDDSERKDNLLSTGFPELDMLLYGGIAAGSAVVLASAPSDERAVLVRNFLETGAKNKQTTFYLATRTSGISMPAEDWLSDFQLFICNSQADAMVKDGPNVFKFNGIENLTEINIALLSVLNKLPMSSNGCMRRACIDILSDTLLQHGPVNTRRWLNSLIPQLKSKGFTVLAVIDPGMHSSKDLHAILDILDGEIDLYEKNTLRGPRRFLRILRMQDQKYSKNEQLIGKP